MNDREITSEGRTVSPRPALTSTLQRRQVLRQLLDTSGAVCAPEIESATGLGSSTVFQILTALRNCGWIEGAPNPSGTHARRRYVALTDDGRRGATELLSPDGPLLKRIRVDRDVTQTEIAEHMHVSPTHVSRIERQLARDLGMLHRYGEALGGSVRVTLQFPDACYMLPAD